MEGFELKNTTSGGVGSRVRKQDQFQSHCSAQELREQTFFSRFVGPLGHPVGREVQFRAFAATSNLV